MRSLTPLSITVIGPMPISIAPSQPPAPISSTMCLPFMPDVSTLYVAFVADPERETEHAIISGKRLTPSDIAAVLTREMPATASLAAAEPIDTRSIPMDLSIADKKMTAGGLSATTVAAAHDWRASAEHLQRQWAMKYSEQTALDRYNHLAVAVQSACAAAYEQTRAESRQGPAMLERLKERLDERKAGGADYFDARGRRPLGMR